MIGEYLRAAPKAELHLHFQGSIRPETLLELAQRHRIDLPAENAAQLRDWFRFRDFAHFVEVYGVLRSCLVEAPDYELVTYELGAALAAQHVRYAEVTFTPGPEVYRGPRETFFDGLTRGRCRVQQDFGVDIRWIFDIPRRSVTLHPDIPLADFITSVAIEGRDAGVVGLGLAGTEAGYPPEPFEPWFNRARAAGLHSSPHAGETAGPESVWGALRALGAERIGHGVRSVEDRSLVEYLVERRIALEVCPTSNIQLGVYPSFREHPLRELLAGGAMVAINTDTPAIFGITLTDELKLLETEFGLPAEVVDQVILNAFEAAFLPDGEREALIASVRRELESLRGATLGA
ncbi:MAG: adenosine deaminase [Chloroflexi bacterium]|nr:adenosine deaminase [Chloroflexota bacterium]